MDQNQARQGEESTQWRKATKKERWKDGNIKVQLRPSYLLRPPPGLAACPPPPTIHPPTMLNEPLSSEAARPEDPPSSHAPCKMTGAHPPDPPPPSPLIARDDYVGSALTITMDDLLVPYDPVPTIPPHGLPAAANNPPEAESPAMDTSPDFSGNNPIAIVSAEQWIDTNTPPPEKTNNANIGKAGGVEERLRKRVREESQGGTGTNGHGRQVRI